MQDGPAAIIYNDFDDIFIAPDFPFNSASFDINLDGSEDLLFERAGGQQFLQYASPSVRILVDRGVPNELNILVQNIDPGVSIGLDTPLPPYRWLDFDEADVGGRVNAIIYSCFPRPDGGPPECTGEFFGLNGRGFLGFELTLDDGPHYGWFDIGGSQLFAYAYESEPNVPIIAGAIPEPSPMLFALLALGALHITLGRSRPHNGWA